MPPCETVQTTNVELGKVNKELMIAALRSMGLNPVEQGLAVFFNGGTYHWKIGGITLSGYDVEKRTAELKRAYSAEVVKSQAKKFGWALKETAKYQYEVVKRSV